jgi:cytolysin-activating lysine-acyltransferase
MTASTKTPTTAAAPPAAPAPQPAADDPEVQKKLHAVRAQMRESFGSIVMALMALPRYRDQSLGDLRHLVLEPLLRDRLVTAHAGDGERVAGGEIAGIALWASVSEEVDASIRRQIREGVFPIRLKADDWNSGPVNWLLDVVAADQTATARVIANFRQVVKEGGLRLHPLITKLVDEETLKKMGVEKAGASPLDPTRA